MSIHRLGSLSAGLLGVIFAGAIAAASAQTPAAPEPAAPGDAASAHAQLLNADNYPSATQCAPCHKQIYDEWRISNHAYAFISPMFHKFEQKINDLAPSIGDFCVRCHGTVSTQLGEPREEPLWERAKVSTEGITCITCHRVDQSFLKENGARNIVPGPIFQPVSGPFEGDVVRNVVQNESKYPIKTSPQDTQRGTPIHDDGFKLVQMSKSEFCVSCHQV